MAKKDRELEPWLQEQSTNPADYPTPEELGLNEPEEVSEDLVLGAGQALTGNFTIRTSKPASGDKYINCYIRGGNGWSGAIVGSPTDSAANVLANCVG